MTVVNFPQKLCVLSVGASLIVSFTDITEDRVVENDALLVAAAEWTLSPISPVKYFSMKSYN